MMIRPSIASALVASMWLTGCVLEIKSSGELDDDGDTGAVDDTEFEASTESTDGSPGGCIGDCPSPAEPTWTRVVDTETGSVFSCDVEIDPIGRVALAWRTGGTDAYPNGRTGIDLIAPDGSLLESTVVEGQVFSKIAFASDGTLRARGASIVGSGTDGQWAMALDDALDPTWQIDYAEAGGFGQCDFGTSAALIDATDHLVTYNYACAGVVCPQSIVRRHAPDGSVLWETNVGGNPGLLDTPVAVGSDQSVFHAGTYLYDDTSATIELRKFSADGQEQWTLYTDHELAGLWGDAEGGVYMVASDFNGFAQLQHVDADGILLSTSDPLPPGLRVFAPAADDSGFFVAHEGQLQRTNLDLAPIWSAPIEPGQGSLDAFAVSDGEDTFALAGSKTGEGNNYWLTMMATP
ncbi:MAG: hypothetical protein AAF799_22455 [Myxococcota bacterium]